MAELLLRSLGVLDLLLERYDLSLVVLLLPGLPLVLRLEIGYLIFELLHFSLMIHGEIALVSGLLAQLVYLLLLRVDCLLQVEVLGHLVVSHVLGSLQLLLKIVQAQV